MASITCAKCKGTHDSVRLVRACHEGYLVLTMTLTDNLNQRPVFCVDCRIRNTSHQNAEGTVGRYLASDLHPEACTKLQHELELAPMMPMKTEACVWEGTWEEWVTLYRAHVAHATGTPRPNRVNRYAAVKKLRQEAREVLASLVPDHSTFRVAVQLDPTDKLRFFQIDTPLKGQWVGCVFMKEQASDETYKVRDIAREEAVLRLVIADAKGALTRYGLELGACGMCGRTLTDEESRARGIGPVCIEKL